MANETLGTGALRLTAPTATAYDQSPGEQLLLRGLTPENLGGMYGLLMNQRAGGMAGQDAYRRDLAGVNQQQYGLAQAKLAADELENLRRTGIDLIDKGGVDASNVGPLQSLMLDRGATLQTDALRRQGTRAKALSDMGSGLNNLSQAGVNLNPGQQVSLDPAQLGQLRSTTGDPRSITEQRISAGATLGAARARASADDGVVYESRIGNLPGEDYDTVKGKNQAEVMRMAQARREQRARGGGLTGPAAGAGGGTAPSASGAASGIRTPQQAVALGREQGLTSVFEQGGRWFGRDRQGATVPVR